MKGAHVDIIDPIHSFIRVANAERRLVDHPIFQRLRWIKQLSSAYLVYPGAQHTRFGHSLGVMHIAGQAAGSLMEKGLIKESQREELRLAGLLHDIGHGPFSHHFEEVMREKGGPTHEEIGAQIIKETEIGDILSEYGYDKRKIARLAVGMHRTPFMNEILSGALSADMMDYLLRDAYHTGAEHAKIDHQRITRSLNVYRRRLALESSAAYSLESMMHSRYQMFRAVYYHKTVRAAEIILLEAIRLADDSLDFTSPRLADYLQLTDDAVLVSLMEFEEYTESDQRAKDLAYNYRTRRLPKCVFERMHTGAKRRPVNKRKLRLELSLISKVDEDQIFVDSSYARAIPVLPNQDSPSVVFLSGRGGKRKASTVPMSDMRLISPITGSMHVLRVYAYGKNKSKIEKAANSILGDMK